MEEEQAEEKNDEDEADNHGDGKIVDSAVDRGSRPVDRGIDLDAGKAGAQFFEFVLDRPSHVECVFPRKLLNYQEEAGTLVDDGVPDEQLMTFDYLSHVREAHVRLLLAGG